MERAICFVFLNAPMTLEEMSVFELERHQTKVETMATSLLSEYRDGRKRQTSRHVFALVLDERAH